MLLFLLACSPGPTVYDESNCVEECPRLDTCEATDDYFACSGGECDSEATTYTSYSHSGPCSVAGTCCSVEPHPISQQLQIVCVYYPEVPVSSATPLTDPSFDPRDCTTAEFDECYTLICSPCDQYPSAHQAEVCAH